MSSTTPITWAVLSEGLTVNLFQRGCINRFFERPLRRCAAPPLGWGGRYIGRPGLIAHGQSSPLGGCGRRCFRAIFSLRWGGQGKTSKAWQRQVERALTQGSPPQWKRSRNDLLPQPPRGELSSEARLRGRHAKLNLPQPHRRERSRRCCFCRSPPSPAACMIKVRLLTLQGCGVSRNRKRSPGRGPARQNEGRGRESPSY